MSHKRASYLWQSEPDDVRKMRKRAKNVPYLRYLQVKMRKRKRGSENRFLDKKRKYIWE